MAAKKTFRSILALLIAPIFASAFWTGLMATFAFVVARGDFTRFLQAWMVAAAAGSAIAIFAAAIIGVSIHKFLYRRKLHSAWAYVIFGAALGLIIGLIPAALKFGENPNALIFIALDWSLYAVPIGALTALFAWMIRRPDRDASPLPMGERVSANTVAR